MLDALLRAIVLAQDAGAPAGGGNGPPAGGGGQGVGGLLGSPLILIAMLGLMFWFMVMRPQRQKDKERQQMLAALKKNDHVVTIGGIHGVVVSLKPEADEVILKVDETSNVKLRFSRSAIARVVSSESEETSTTE